MKRFRISPGSVWYRAMVPRWSHLPLSGAGAAHKGSRFNRPGLETLYLADTPMTALAEFLQDSPMLGPVVLASYVVGPVEVADLTGEQPVDDPWRDWRAPWRLIANIQKTTPPSWACGDAALAARLDGIRYPSTRREGGTALALYTGDIAPDKLAVYDPDGSLPKTALSWR